MEIDIGEVGEDYFSSLCDLSPKNRTTTSDDSFAPMPCVTVQAFHKRILCRLPWTKKAQANASVLLQKNIALSWLYSFVERSMDSSYCLIQP